MGSCISGDTAVTNVFPCCSDMNDYKTFTTDLDVDILAYNAGSSNVIDKFKKKFSKAVKGLSCKPGIRSVDNVTDIDGNRPVFVICHNHSRLGTDIHSVMDELKDINVSLVAVVVIHVAEKHALPETMPTEHLIDKAFTNLGLLVDVAFSMEKGTFDFGSSFKGIYKCEMNKIARKKIEKFLDRMGSRSETYPTAARFQDTRPTKQDACSASASSSVESTKLNTKETGPQTDPGSIRDHLSSEPENVQTKMIERVQNLEEKVDVLTEKVGRLERASNLVEPVPKVAYHLEEIVSEETCHRVDAVSKEVCHLQEAISEENCHFGEVVPEETCHREEAVSTETCHLQEAISEEKCHLGEEVPKETCNREEAVSKETCYLQEAVSEECHLGEVVPKEKCHREEAVSKETCHLQEAISEGKCHLAEAVPKETGAIFEKTENLAETELLEYTKM